jgi:hypothetical protein
VIFVIEMFAIGFELLKMMMIMFSFFYSDQKLLVHERYDKTGQVLEREKVLDCPSEAVDS